MSNRGKIWGGDKQKNEIKCPSDSRSLPSLRSPSLIQEYLVLMCVWPRLRVRREHLQAARGGTICTGGRPRAREKPSNEGCDKIESLMRGILGGVLWEYDVPSNNLTKNPHWQGRTLWARCKLILNHLRLFLLMKTNSINLIRRKEDDENGEKGSVMEPMRKGRGDTLEETPKTLNN